MKWHVVVAHDDEQLLSDVVGALRAVGFVAVGASSSRLALDVLDSTRCVDVLVTRFAFETPPNGVALVLRARNKRRYLPTLFVASPGMAEQTSDFGEFLPSFVRPDQIVAAVRRMTEPDYVPAGELMRRHRRA